jgi:hypothetical protein
MKILRAIKYSLQRKHFAAMRVLLSSATLYVVLLQFSLLCLAMLLVCFNLPLLRSIVFAEPPFEM